MNDFDGLVAVVTGGASGIGLAAAKLLHSRGAGVAVLDLDPDDLPEGILGLKTDVTDDAQVPSAIDTVTERFGRLDVVVNNAGIGAVGDVTGNSDDEWLRARTSMSSAWSGSPATRCRIGGSRPAHGA